MSPRSSGPSGEWLAQAHGTRYRLRHEPFVIFDIMTGAERSLSENVFAKCAIHGFTTPRILSFGPSVSIEKAMSLLDRAHHGAIDEIEGCVWRVQRNGEVDFLAKYIRPEKVDGRYLPEVSGDSPVWNWRP
ncbi:MAG TPA: RNA ligase family protein [Candidatus Binatus sp.]|nr:RNA ligase family protein [Candidatus Binatus sp.]